MSSPATAAGAGIIGFGFMGRTHAAGYLAAREAGLPVTLRAVTGAPGGQLPEGVTQLDDARALLAREDISLVSICTPTDSHIELVRVALDAGKHVLVEKPVALRSAEVLGLARAARDSGRVCLPAMCMRFWPGWPWLRERVVAGTFGAVRRADFLRLSAVPSWGAGFYADHARSGAALFDLHIHDVDFLRWCFGDPVAVTSAGTAVDVTTAYQYAHARPAVTARGAWLAQPAVPFTMRYSVRFDDAMVRFDFADPRRLRVIRRGTEEPVTLPADDAYHLEIRHFIELALGRVDRPVATLDEAAAVTRILEAEAQSLATGGSVALVPLAG